MMMMMMMKTRRRKKKKRMKTREMKTMFYATINREACEYYASMKVVISRKSMIKSIKNNKMVSWDNPPHYFKRSISIWGSFNVLIV